MSKTNTSFHIGCSGILDLLQVVFITLKVVGVTKVASWSWWAVLTPIWIQLALFLVIVIFCIIAIVAGKAYP